MTLQGTCEENPRCVAAGVKGNCCPTTDGWGYLDCCSAVSFECHNGNCTFTSTQDYLDYLADRDGAPTSAAVREMVVGGGATVFLSALFAATVGLLL